MMMMKMTMTMTESSRCRSENLLGSVQVMGWCPFVY